MCTNAPRMCTASSETYRQEGQRGLGLVERAEESTGPEFKFQLCPSLSYVISLGYSFFNCKMVMLNPTSKGCCGHDIYKAPGIASAHNGCLVMSNLTMMMTVSCALHSGITQSGQNWMKGKWRKERSHHIHCGGAGQNDLLQRNNGK